MVLIGNQYFRVCFFVSLVIHYICKTNPKVLTAVLKINIQELDARFIEKMKAEHATSDLEIHVVDAAGESPRLDEAGFWNVISKLDWDKVGDDAAVLEPAVEYLSKQPLSQVYQFVDQLAEKLHLLDTKAHAQVFLDDEEAEGYLSPDDFLYARCAVVASGEAAFKTVLADPAKMPTELTFEPLLHLANAAYRRKTGKEAILKPAISYETYSNLNGWKS